MKRLINFATLLCVLAAAFSMLTFSACNKSDLSVELLESSDTIAVVQAKKTGGSLEDALKELKERGKLDYDGSSSETGFFITSINGHVADSGKNEFWAIYTSLGSYEGNDYSNSEYGTYKYDGRDYASALYGVSGMPLIEGEIYIIVLATY